MHMHRCFRRLAPFAQSRENQLLTITFIIIIIIIIIIVVVVVVVINQCLTPTVMRYKSISGLQKVLLQQLQKVRLWGSNLAC